MIGPLLFSISVFFPRTAARPLPGQMIAGMAGSGGPVRRLATLVSTWLKDGAERPRLQSLSDHMLRDIGVPRRDLER